MALATGVGSAAGAGGATSLGGGDAFAVTPCFAIRSAARSMALGAGGADAVSFAICSAARSTALTMPLSERSDDFNGAGFSTARAGGAAAFGAAGGVPAADLGPAVFTRRGFGAAGGVAGAGVCSGDAGALEA